tara:strand:+ start:1038 stop:1529 length:492 start_codon:yes stop_codon:yes gene_type:complete
MTTIRKYKHTVDDTTFVQYVKESFSIAQVLTKCKLATQGSNYRSFKQRVKSLSLDTSHFTGQSYLKGKRNKHVPELSIEDAFVKGGSLGSSTLSKKIQKYSLKPYECSNMKCNIHDKWLGERISLHLDHIDGDNTNNELDNLRFLCPNCHSQTSTYCRNVKKV